MHFYCCNDAVPWLNEAKSRIFRCSDFFKISKFTCISSATCLPACRKTRFCFVYGSNFSHKECNWCLQYEFVVPKKIYTLRPDDSLHPSLFFSKMSNSQKKVLITPGLYFPNYCVTYLPCDFSKCEHLNLRRE